MPPISDWRLWRKRGIIKELVTAKEVVKITNKQGNGHKKEYDPEVEYEYLSADVWVEDDKKKPAKDVKYSEDVINRLEEDSEEPENPNNPN